MILDKLSFHSSSKPDHNNTNQNNNISYSKQNDPSRDIVSDLVHSSGSSNSNDSNNSSNSDVNMLNDEGDERDKKYSNATIQISEITIESDFGTPLAQNKNDNNITSTQNLYTSKNILPLWNNHSADMDLITTSNTIGDDEEGLIQMASTPPPINQDLITPVTSRNMNSNSSNNIASFSQNSNYNHNNSSFVINNNNNKTTPIYYQQPQSLFSSKKLQGSVLSLASSIGGGNGNSNINYTSNPGSSGSSSSHTINGMMFSSPFITLLLDVYQQHTQDPTVTPYDCYNPPSGVLNIVAKKTVKLALKTKVELGSNIDLHNDALITNIRQLLLKKVRENGYLSRNGSLVSLPPPPNFLNLPHISNTTNNSNNIGNNATNNSNNISSFDLSSRESSYDFGIHNTINNTTVAGNSNNATLGLQSPFELNINTNTGAYDPFSVSSVITPINYSNSNSNNILNGTTTPTNIRPGLKSRANSLLNGLTRSRSNSSNFFLNNGTITPTNNNGNITPSNMSFSFTSNPNSNANNTTTTTTTTTTNNNIPSANLNYNSIGSIPVTNGCTPSANFNSNSNNNSSSGIGNKRERGNSNASDIFYLNK